MLTQMTGPARLLTGGSVREPDTSVRGRTPPELPPSRRYQDAENPTFRLFRLAAAPLRSACALDGVWHSYQRFSADVANITPLI